MRILIVVNDAEAGGAETLLEALYRDWPPEDRLHLVVILGRGMLSSRLEAVFPAVSYLEFPRSGWNVIKLRNAAQRVADEFRPDVVHSNLIQSDLLSLICNLRGARRVSTVHTSGRTAGGRAPENEWVARIVGMLSGRLDSVVASHDSCLPYAARVGLPKPVAVIPNGVVVPTQPPAPAESRQFLSLARWHPMKGHEDLFRAFAQTGLYSRGWTLTCAGEGVSVRNPEMDELLARTDPLGLMRSAVHLCGPQDDVLPLLARSAALVSSSRYGETYPMVGMEACAAATTVIATDVGGSADFVVDPRFLVAPGDWQALARAMTAFAELPDAERAALGVRSWAKARAEFDIDERRGRYRAVFASPQAS